MKTRIALVLVALTIATNLNAQEPIYRNIYGELYGPSNWLGASYDCRIKGGSPWGYRAGLSYISDVQSYAACRGVGIPLEFNCILGKRASKFEAGVGVNLIFYSKDYIYDSRILGHIRSGFGYYTYFNIGYRLQYRSGFNFRAGISPSFAWGSHGVYKGLGMEMMPYLSFGYTFRN